MLGRMAGEKPTVGEKKNRTALPIFPFDSHDVNVLDD